jgi:hypothetical protein
LCSQSDMFGLFHSFFLYFYACVHMLVDGWMGVHVCSGLTIGNWIVDMFPPSVQEMAGYDSCGLCHH